MKSILVTGCSSGIGAHCARKLRDDGWQVFATARSTEALETLENLNIQAIFMDYCQPDSIKDCFETVLQATGGNLDALFNNGAYGQAGAVEDITTEVLRQQFEANFFGWHTLTNLALPVMRKQGHGRIIHCSSILGWVPSLWRGAYCSSKYALEGLASTMRLELKIGRAHV